MAIRPRSIPRRGPAAYTMVIRVNKDTEVDELDELLGERIMQRDVFVINAEYPGSKPNDWERARRPSHREVPLQPGRDPDGTGAEPR